MKPNVDALIKLRLLFSVSHGFLCLPRNPFQKTPTFSIVTTCSTLCQNQVEVQVEEGLNHFEGPIEILRRLGCSDTDMEKIFLRRPSLCKADHTSLQYKLNILWGLGLTSSELVKIIICRPRVLSCRINHLSEERIEFFITFFGSRDVLRKAIVRYPSLLTYDFHNMIKPTIALYEGMGVGRKDLITMILSRPALIPRTSFNDEKMEYLRKSGVSKDSKMYKYVVTLIGISRHETIREKVANFEKFGISDDEIWGLFGRSPLTLTLSVDKVQRNMTFVVGTLKLPASVVLQCPFLLYNNLDAVLKPRLLLAGKIQEMALCPRIKGPLMLRALRMREKRFLKAFVTCHVKDVAEELMEFYRKVKSVKRLAEASKKQLCKGFPF